MNIKKENLNLLISTLIFSAILFMSIGYSALNKDLTISGDATVLAAQGIKITNITLKEVTNGGYETYSSSLTYNSTNMFVTLPNANSTVTYLIEVTNSDNIYYHLNSIIETSNSNNNIGYEIVDKEAQYFLENSVSELEIKFYHKNTSITETNISLNLNYQFSEVNYRKIDYIRTTGTQWMYTGLMNTGDYIFEDEFLITDTGSGNSTGSWIIGGRVNPDYSLGIFVNNTQVIGAYGTTTQIMTPKVEENKWYEMYFSRERLTIGGINYNLQGEALIPESQIAEIILGGNLLAYDGVSRDNRNMLGMRKYFKVTDATDGTVLRYYIPVMLNDTGKIGYWDEINSQFHENDGTGEFLYP